MVDSVMAEGGCSRMSCANILEKGLTRKEYATVVACLCNGVARDMSFIPSSGDTLDPVFRDSEQALPILRHSASHIMAAAVKRLYPNARPTIGPSTEHGFYYDFAVESPFTIEDLPAIEAEMKKIIKEDIPFTVRVMPKKDALVYFSQKGEAYKVELLESIDEDTVTVYSCGDFEDLCRGPHIPSTGCVGAISLLSVAGAYWRGDEKNAMLSRIYGTAFPTEEALKEYHTQMEEAKKRDHRKLGKELGLFGFEENVAPGMAFWYPKGMLLRTILEDFLRKEHLRRGYELVQGPQVLRRSVWEHSGHYDNYRENMYFTQIEEDTYGVKPMNCVGHMFMYKASLRSYRDLPVRFFELGVVHRHEKSGTLHGLMRVRQFTQDDAHIICMPEQLGAELIGVIQFVKDLLNIFGFSYTIEVSTRPEKSIGSDEAWDLATKALFSAVEHEGMQYTINHGDGAFYGPKIDVKLVDSIGRKWQCSTIQCDFTLPERFDLSYIGSDGEKHRPVMVHRAILGSIERFIGIVTESYAGVFPLWLAPEQVRVVPVAEAHMEFALEVQKELSNVGFRACVDESNNKLGYKIREAQLAKVQYVLVVGDKEITEQSVNVRLHSGENLGMKTVQELATIMNAELEAPFINGGTSYKFIY